MKIVHVASEFSPWVRVGHLADAVGGLCAELAREGHEVAVFLPGYRQVLADPRAANAELLYEHALELGDGHVSAQTLRLPIAKNLTLYLIRRDESFDRTFPYGPPGGEYEDSDSRFLIFCKAVADALCRFDQPVDIVHCHDWPTALLPLLLRVEERKRSVSAAARTVFTVHHPAFQGIYPRRTFALTNLPEEFFAPDSLEFFGQVNFLKGGLVYAEVLLAPSPSAARQIPAPGYAFGLEGVLARRSGDLRGLLTGLDDVEWNPAMDQFLPVNFRAGAPKGKARCREALRQGLGLFPTTRDGALIAAPLPLMASLGLGDPRELLPDLRDDTVLVLLGRAAPGEQEPWRTLAGARQGRVILLENYEPGALHRALGGADFYLGTSRIEPSPFRAQRALRYGAIPVMPRTGGPQDVIVDADENPDAGTGLLFEPTLEGWREGLRRAQDLHDNVERSVAVRERALAVDSSWKKLAPAYAQLYKESA
ncbi:MAG TPA: glycogen/starch synthase [Opitutales bacterium]|jgi:starch synthase|nr:glycogen/starch synthase [Opitutales bacterium]